MGNCFRKQPEEIPQIYANYEIMSTTFTSHESDYLIAMHEIIQKTKSKEEKMILHKKRETVLNAHAEVRSTFHEVHAIRIVFNEIQAKHDIIHNLNLLQEKYENQAKNLKEALHEFFLYGVDSNPKFETWTCRRFYLSNDQRQKCKLCKKLFPIDAKFEVCPSCKNRFHRRCINRYLDNHGKCLLCHKPLKRRKDTHKLSIDNIWE